ncbi:predicted protein [Histoplasma capsulatum G186AR]|uniref:Uncharacterized protein n=1 Tax=Ajellomyces capsulatus (strain G186AR / H82 / ATCC MYA-2454 / RMSCC 2432) TaxID=447093 RepID=C0NC09_AJECG|nr:uncharacterized protein HCBG_00655 [Histoplasma capsulatum G186AR]EEH11200.1 predicted protein [Histoplasma capsulatum G186AR]
MRNQEDGRVGNGSRGKGECEGEGRLLGEGYLRHSTAIVIFGPWARLSWNTDVILLLGFKRGHCLDSIGRHDEACSRERDRWHLEQRTISKVDTTVFEDSEEERGVSPVLEVLEEDSCIEAEVELMMYWEMRFASRRGRWVSAEILSEIEIVGDSRESRELRKNGQMRSDATRTLRQGSGNGGVQASMCRIGFRIRSGKTGRAEQEQGEEKAAGVENHSNENPSRRTTALIPDQ